MRKKNPLAIEMLLTKIEVEINDLLLIPYLDQATVNYLTMKKRLLNEGREYLLRMSEKGSLFLEDETSLLIFDFPLAYEELVHQFLIYQKELKRLKDQGFVSMNAATQKLNELNYFILFLGEEWLKEKSVNEQQR